MEGLHIICVALLELTVTCDAVMDTAIGERGGHPPLRGSAPSETNMGSQAAPTSRVRLTLFDCIRQQHFGCEWGTFQSE